MRVVYSAPALNDLEQIERYYAERTTSAFARQFVERITTTFERLVTRNPRAGRLRKDLDPDVRLLPVLPYLVFYRIAGGRAQVWRILHGHRNLKAPLASLLAV